MKIAIGSDHAGFALKQKVMDHFAAQGIDFNNVGTNSEDSCDYPEYAHPVAEQLKNQAFSFGILICGSANGVAMTANKHAHIRAAICWNLEITKLARLHNNANVICIPARFINSDFAIQLIQTFLNTNFEGGRHQRRTDKIPLS